MTPTETLKHEHQIILTVLGAAEREVDSIRATGIVHGGEVRRMLDFIREFADRCHHAKEENLLFRKMEERGMPRDAGPLAVMLNEHDQGRAFVREADRSLPAAETGDHDALVMVAKSLAGYSDLLRSHISKEDNVLYPMADSLLTRWTSGKWRRLSNGWKPKKWVRESTRNTMRSRWYSQGKQFRKSKFCSD